ncbi:MAG: hypothetical protein M3Q06_01800 [Bacteroidota bacterium]|nr:hypothetical protein [Bacteroidota bacterium]
MAKICSFQIQYKNQSFPALVSFASTERDVVCTVHFIESKIGHLEPGDKLVYCRQNGLQQPINIPQELSVELNRCFQEWVSSTPSHRA